MTIIEVLVGIAALLWIIPGVYVVQSGSYRIAGEALLLLALCLALPYVIRYAENEMYGLAAQITLNDALFIGVIQLVLWLGGLMIGLHANQCRIPPRIASRIRDSE
jgi:hypothetical protein